MKKPPTDQANVWEEDTTATRPKTRHGHEVLAEPPQRTQTREVQEDVYDIEGLMTDFPTARELERFVFDETGYVLNLKGRANRMKYQVALDALLARDIDPKFLGTENPYVDKADMVPVEDIRDPPPRDAGIPDRTEVQNMFHSRKIPHTDPDFRAQGRCIDVTFRKYNSGMITYDVMGPIDQRPYGEKIDKFGRLRPEIIKWVDPRTGEQIVQRADGSLTPVGKRLRALMQTMRVNNSNQWDIWIDREFISTQDHMIRNPWDTQE